MVRSMTGYGRGIKSYGTRKITAEIRSVNHRYLELQTKIPREFYPLDSKIRELLSSRISRGKVDVVISDEWIGEHDCDLSFDMSKAGFYVNAAREISEKFNIESGINALEILKIPGFVSETENSDETDSLWEMLKPALDEALDQLIRQRENEGARLRDDLLTKVDLLSSDVEYVETIAPDIIEKYKADLTEKVRQVIDTIPDENRIAEEVTIYADKICIDEELTRLKSHVSALRQCFSIDEPVGRKLDFLSQELNREANTILSKSSDVRTADLGIRIKTTIEKIREQIQNIE